MDSSDYPSLPRLSLLHARLAANSRKVEDVVDGQLDGIERLFHATTSENWAAVALVTRQLAEQNPEEVGDEVVRTARRLCQELGLPSSTQRPKHLESLLAACRATRQRHRKS